MSIITSEAHFRQRVLKYSLKYGVTKASNRFGRSRQAIYEWRAKWDGKSWHSLVEKSHRPHHHPAEHTPEEKEMILRRYPRYKDFCGILCAKAVIHEAIQASFVLYVNGYNRKFKSEPHARISLIQERNIPGRRYRWM